MKYVTITAFLFLLSSGCREQEELKQDERLSSLERRIESINTIAHAADLARTNEPVSPSPTTTVAPALSPPQALEPEYEMVGSPNFLGEGRRLYPTQRRCEDAKEALIGPIRSEREREVEAAGNASATYYLPRVTCVPT